jgi:hypothetical protein
MGSGFKFTGRMIKGYLAIMKLMFRSATRPWGEKYPNAARHIERVDGYSRKSITIED